MENRGWKTSFHDVIDIWELFQILMSSVTSCLVESDAHLGEKLWWVIIFQEFFQWCLLPSEEPIPLTTDKGAFFVLEWLALENNRQEGETHNCESWRSPTIAQWWWSRQLSDYEKFRDSSHFYQSSFEIFWEDPEWFIFHISQVQLKLAALTSITPVCRNSPVVPPCWRITKTVNSPREAGY